MFCSKCGNRFATDARFCAKCGAPRVNGLSSRQDDETQLIEHFRNLARNGPLTMSAMQEGWGLYHKALVSGDPVEGTPIAQIAVYRDAGILFSLMAKRLKERDLWLADFRIFAERGLDAIIADEVERGRLLADDVNVVEPSAFSRITASPGIISWLEEELLVLFLGVGFKFGDPMPLTKGEISVLVRWMGRDRVEGADRRLREIVSEKGESRPQH